jgi:hypothetical protein
VQLVSRTPTIDNKKPAEINISTRTVQFYVPKSLFARKMFARTLHVVPHNHHYILELFWNVQA